MSIASQDVYLNLTTPVSVVGAGGGSSNPNPSFSSISTLALNNISSINGSAYVPGSLPENPVFQSISTLGISNLSSINGVAYVAGVPANLVVSTLTTNGNTGYVSTPQVVLGTGMQVYQQNTSTLGVQSPSTIILQAPNTKVTNLTAVGANVSTLTVSSINGVNSDDLPFLFEFTTGLVDSVISSINVAVTGPGNLPAVIAACGARLTPYISTIDNHKYTVTGCMQVSTVTGGFPAGTPNAYLTVFGGGGPGQGFGNPITFSYPQISTLSYLGAGSATLQWSAPGGHSPLNQSGFPGSTITYYAYCSPDWPVPIAVAVSTLVGTVTINDLATVSVLDHGAFNLL